MAALAVGVPTVLHGVGGPSRASAAGNSTVLASGLIDGKQWSFVTEDPEPKGCPGYVSARWDATRTDTCLGQMPGATDPVFLSSGGGNGEANFFIAQLRADVGHVTVTGTDGAVQTPAVAKVLGRRYAFFALPAKQGIARLDAYAGDGKAMAFTVPYNGRDNSRALIESWYPAGTTPTQATVNSTLFSGTTSSSMPVQATVDMGPFGVCLSVSAPQDMTTEGTVYGPDCSSVTPPAATKLSWHDYSLGDRDLLLAEVNNAVDRVDATLSDGTTTRLTPVRVGGRSFVVTFLATGVKLSGAKTYDASGTRLAQSP